jgi:hypothetical protein
MTARSTLWELLRQKSGIASTGAWEGHRVQARHGSLRLVLDSYKDPAESFEHTRLVVGLPTLGFRFRIHEPNAFSWVGTLFGLLDIEIGEKQFDHDWVIKSNSPGKIRQLLADPDLRHRIDALEHCALSLEADKSAVEPEQTERRDELVLIVAELQTTEDQLRAMFDLLFATIERLEALAPGWG